MKLQIFFLYHTWPIKQFWCKYFKPLGIKIILVVKGQIISEQNCGVLNFPKEQRNYCKDFSPSLYNGSNKKNKGYIKGI